MDKRLYKILSAEEKNLYVRMSARQQEEFERQKLAEKGLTRTDSGRIPSGLEKEGDIEGNNRGWAAQGTRDNKDTEEEVKNEDQSKEPFYEREEVKPDFFEESVPQKVRTNTVDKSIYIMFVIDATYSMGEVIGNVYSAIKKIVNCIAVKTENLSGCSVLYGLTYFHDQNQIKCEEYSPSKYFTTDKESFLNSIKRMKIKGGDDDGYEKGINPAVLQGIKKLENITERAERGLFLITDSLPPAEDRRPDYTIIDGRESKGVRFAVTYTYKAGEYLPEIKIVNGNGYPGSEKNVGVDTCSLSQLFDKKEGLEKIDTMIKDLMYKSSVRVSY